MGTTLFTNVNVIDGSGSQPYPGEVLVKENRITAVARGGGGALPRTAAEVVDGGGQATLSRCQKITYRKWC